MEHPSGSVGHFIGEKNKLVEVFNNQLETHNLYLVPNPEFVKKKNINNARILIYLNPEKNFLSKSFKLHVKDLLCVAPVYGKKIVESLQRWELTVIQIGAAPFMWFAKKVKNLEFVLITDL